MADLGKSFSLLDGVPAPDVWEAVVVREPRQAPVPPPRRRAMTAAVALGIFAIGLVLAWSALRPSEGSSTMGATGRPTTGPTGPTVPEGNCGDTATELHIAFLANEDFDATCYAVPADTPFTIEFRNSAVGVPANVAIYRSDCLDETCGLFVGEAVVGEDPPTFITYVVDALPAGTYVLANDINPLRTRTTLEVRGDAVTGSAPPPDPTVTPVVVAEGLAFDTDEIVLAAATTMTVTLDHRDTDVHHNISIYGDMSLEQVVFTGKVILGPAVEVYALPALSAGEYYFQCDVHPTMNGTVVVRGTDGGGERGGTGSTGQAQPSD